MTKVKVNNVPKSTGQALELLGLEVRPEFHRAGNLYANALFDINYLEALLVRASQVSEIEDPVERGRQMNEIMVEANLAEDNSE